MSDRNTNLLRVCNVVLAMWISPELLIAQDFPEIFEPFEPAWLFSEGESGEGAEEGHLETDRDSFTPATSTVSKGRTIFETAYSYSKTREGADAHSLPEIVTRIGLTERVELRLGWNYEVEGGGSVSHGGGFRGEAGAEEESQTLYGIKVALTSQDGWRPGSSCIIQGRTPTSGPETKSDFQLGYVFGWEFEEVWQLDSSLRYASTNEEEDDFNQWAPSVVIKYQASDRWNVHGEYFGIFSDGREVEMQPQYFSPGVHYLISEDIEIGVRTGWGLNDDSADFFTNVGLGLRF
ncbi:MAG: transporter [Planctomyces sp.]|nr:transporter [Planctomyces sp.]